MLTLIYAETIRSFRVFRRYPLEVVSLVCVLVIVFLLLFLGASYLAGSQARFGNRLETMTISYVAWLLVTGVFSGLAGEIQSDSQSGTLEQLFLGHRSFVTIAVARIIGNLGLNLAITATMLVIIMLLTGTRLDLSPEALAPMAVLVVGAAGLGLIAGALVLIFKRGTALLSLGQFGLLFLMMVPLSEKIGVVGYVWPLSSGAEWLRVTLTYATPAQPQIAVYACVNAAAYFLVGLLALTLAARRVKASGSLAHH